MPPLKVRLPDDARSALSAATDSVLCVIVVPPEYVLPPAAAGATVNVPAPVFSTAPVPPIVPVYVPALSCWKRTRPLTVATKDAVVVPSVPVRFSVPLCTSAVENVPVPAHVQFVPAIVRLWKFVNAFDAVPVPCSVLVLVPAPPFAVPTICEPVCRISVTLPLPPWIAVPPPPWISPALVIVVAPLVERTPMPLLLMILPPAWFVIVAVNELPSVFDTTASTLPPLVALPVVWLVPLVIVPLPPSSDAARALLLDIVTVPVLTIWLPDAPGLLCHHAAVIPYELLPVVVIVPLLTSVLLLPFAAIPSLYAPVVEITRVAPLVSVLPLFTQSSAAPRFITPVPLPDIGRLPLLVIALDVSTENGVRVVGNT